MSNETAKIDDNRERTLLGVTDDANAEIRRLLVDPTTGRLKVSAIITSLDAAVIADGSVSNTEFQYLNGVTSGSITASNLAANTITANEIAANTITASQIAANTITASQIAAGTITATQLAANTITANEIAANTITASQMNVSQLSAISANLGTITAGTVTGATLQTASTGRRVVITSDQYIRWNNGTSTEGYIYNDSSGNMIIDADNSVYLRADGSGDYIYLQAGQDIYLTSNNLIMTQTGNWQINECDSFIVNFNDDDSGAGVYFNEDGGLAMSISSGKDVWIADNCSAASFTDRTPYYDGESALSDIKQITGKKNLAGKMGVDHDTLPEFIRKEVKHKDGDGNEFIQAERDLGNTISLLIEAVKELDARLDKIEYNSSKNNIIK